MKNLSRRAFIKTGLAGVLGLMLPVFTRNLIAEEKPLMDIRVLIDILKSTNNPVCVSAAATLLLLKDNQSGYDLHLRSANLNNVEVARIAEAIKTTHDAGGPSLRSFSMSYNQQLSDEGVLSLVKTLPSTLTEIGLVGCGIGDKGGEALMAWASGAPKLHWFCVEQNAFSNQVKARLIEFGKQRSGLLVVV